MVEHLIGNEKVPSSILGGSTKQFLRMNMSPRDKLEWVLPNAYQFVKIVSVDNIYEVHFLTKSTDVIKIVRQTFQYDQRIKFVNG